MPNRLGIMGGTFDPVHLGHLRTAEEALEALELERVLFVPAADPPHKSGSEILPFEHRRRMLELSIAGNPRFQVSDLEREMPGKSYTVNSLRRLRKGFPGTELFFLVGLDAFLEMESWFCFRELFRLASLVVLRRPDHGEEPIGEFLRQKVSDLYRRDSAEAAFRHPDMLPVHCLRNTRLDISSTLIRELAAEGRSVRYLVPRAVEAYISEQRLYRQNGRISKGRRDARSGKCGGSGK